MIVWVIVIAVVWPVSLAVVGRLAYLRGSENEVERYLQAIRKASLTPNGTSARRMRPLEGTVE